VHEGEATVAGAILAPSDDVQWIHAAHCHAVPVLRTADETVLELQPHPAARGLRQLAKLNPAFAKLWNECPEGRESRSTSSTTYQIVCPTVPYFLNLADLADLHFGGHP
jgi:polynucleotide 5'-hydroxyl-kinase GRC3/NOL9